MKEKANYPNNNNTNNNKKIDLFLAFRRKAKMNTVFDFTEIRFEEDPRGVQHFGVPLREVQEGDQP